MIKKLLILFLCPLLLIGATTISTKVNMGLRDMMTGGGKFDYLICEEQVSETTPATGFGKFYFKTDGKPYAKNDAGVESDLTTGTGGAFTDADPTVQNTTTYDVVIGTAAVNGSKLSIDGDDDQVQLSIQGNASQADSIMIIENSAGTELFNFDADGTFKYTSVASLAADGEHFLDVSNSGAYTGSSASEGCIATDDTSNTIDWFDGSVWQEVASYELTKRVIGVLVNDSTALTSGDGKAYFARMPSIYNGWDIVEVSANIVAGTGLVTIQIHNLTQTADILTTLLTVDANEKDSSTAATAAVISGTEDDITTADRYRIDIDGAGTGTTWLEVQMVIQKPF